MIKHAIGYAKLNRKSINWEDVILAGLILVTGSFFILALIKLLGGLAVWAIQGGSIYEVFELIK